MRQRTVPQRYYLVALGLVAGTGLGIIAGVFLNEIALGTALGSGAGLVVGAVADLLVNYRK